MSDNSTPRAYHDILASLEKIMLSLRGILALSNILIANNINYIYQIISTISTMYSGE